MSSETPFEKILDENQKSQFINDGFIKIENFWPEELIHDWDKTIVAFYHQQALKISYLRKNFSKGLDPLAYDSVNDLDKVLLLLEKEDKQTGYQASIMCENSVAQRKLLTHPPFVEACSILLNCNEKLLNYSAGTPFVNIPSSKRLLYRWHTEASYYPKRKNFLNVWFPMFRAKTKDNGTMFFAKGSHKKEFWDFTEYYGFDKDSGKKDTHIQFEIPEKDIENYEKVAVSAKPGDIVIFDRNLVHTSTINTSNEISYTTVLRVSEMRGDYTLSGVMEAKPYSSDYAMAGIIPLE
jgi:hypothetical protein